MRYEVSNTNEPGIAQAFGFDVDHGAAALAGAVLVTGEIDGTAIMKALDSVEAKMSTIADKATEDIKNIGKVTTDTKSAIDALGTEQRVLAAGDEILAACLELGGSITGEHGIGVEKLGLMGAAFTPETLA